MENDRQRKITCSPWEGAQVGVAGSLFGLLGAMSLWQKKRKMPPGGGSSQNVGSYSEGDMAGVGPSRIVTI